MSNWKIPLSDLDYGPEEEAAVLRVLKSKWLSMGPEVQAFEREFAEMQGVKHAFAGANATAGLHLSFAALGLGQGDEIIQPALNFVATANMTVAAGATPVFGDILSMAEPTIDPAHVERLITPRTKAVVVMHYGGSFCRMAEFTELCSRRGLALIEDACHAVGAVYRDARQRPPHGVMAGSIGDISAFSFFANKNLATGEGGMVVMNRNDLAERVRLLRSHGMTTLTWDRHKGHASSYDVVLNGFNYRLDEIHAALGRAQLNKLLHNNERRRRLLSTYHRNLRSSASWILPFADNNGETSAHLMVAVAPSKETRQTVVKKLRELGVQTSLHYPCICDFQAFASSKNQSVNLSREFATRAITLPLYPSLTDEQVEFICSVLAITA